MHLRLRRGTDAERLTITPAEGEPIYVTDTKSLYVGDGSTQGGTLITSAGGAVSLDNLTDVDLTTSPTNGQVLKWNGSAFVPADDVDTTLTITSVSVGDLSDVDLTTPPTTGQVLKWDGNTFVPADDSAGSGSGASSLSDLLDVDLTTPPTVGQVLKWNGSAFVFDFITETLQVNVQGSIFDSTGNIFIDNTLKNIISNQLSADKVFASEIFGTLDGDVLGIDSSILLNSSTRTLIGDVEGDVTGNLFANDLTTIIDSTNKSVAADLFVGDNLRSPAGNDLVLATNNSSLVIDNQAQRIIAINSSFQGDLIGDVIGDVQGSVFGTLEGDMKGSVFSDNSTLLVDGINGALLGTVIGTINTAEPAQVDARNRPDPAITLITNGGEGGIELYSEYYAARQTGANLKLYSHNGTYESRTPITSGEILGQLDLGGHLVGPGQSLDVAPISIRGVLVTESDGISTFPLSKLELLVLNSPNPTTAARATLDHLGTFSSPAIKPGTYADATARDAAITSPEAGMMIFVTDGDGVGNPKFQGNLDGTTSGWVNLN